MVSASITVVAVRRDGSVTVSFEAVGSISKLGFATADEFEVSHCTRCRGY